MAHNRHFAQSQGPGEGGVCPARGAGGGGGTGGRPMKMGGEHSVRGTGWGAVISRIADLGRAWAKKGNLNEIA